MDASKQSAARATPISFDEFIESGFEESSSPFLTPKARGWARLLPLKASLLAAALFIIALTLSFIPHFTPFSNLLLVIVYFVAGVPSLIGSIEDILNFEINIDVLMTLAAFLSVLIGSGLEGALLLVLFSLSGSIEEAVTMKAKGALSNLKYLSPPMAYVIGANGALYPRSVKDISLHTKILVKAGEIVPLDGIVEEGISSVNLVHLTGENLPVMKKPKDEIPAGARNIEGALTIRVTRTSAESTLSKLIQMITKAQQSRPKLQRFVDRISNGYAMSIIALAFIFAFALPLFGHIPFLGLEGSIYRSLAFLVAASPCAIIIAIPIAYLSALSVCAKKGILLKGGVTLDALSRCRVLAFDKTGTLTTGKLSLVEIQDLGPPLKEALSIAFALERGALHPIAEAITSYAQKNNVVPLSLDHFRVIPGLGLEAMTILNGENVPVFLGRPEGVYKTISDGQRRELQNAIQRAESEGRMLAVLKVKNHLTLFQFRDTIRPGVAKVIANLKKRYKIVMLTGDHEQSARSVARELGIENYYAGLQPEDKLEIVTRLSEREGLAMIGDGINDAPALARATVGISMGQVGSSTAIDASEVILLQDNLELIEWLMQKAHATVKIVLQNLCLAGAVITLATTPALLGLVPLWTAVLLHEGGTVIVGLNGLRLLRKS